MFGLIITFLRRIDAARQRQEDSLQELEKRLQALKLLTGHHIIKPHVTSRLDPAGTADSSQLSGQWEERTSIWLSINYHSVCLSSSNGLVGFGLYCFSSRVWFVKLRTSCFLGRANSQLHVTSFRSFLQMSPEVSGRGVYIV